MLTLIENLNTDDLAPALADYKSRVEAVLALRDAVPLEIFAYLNNDLQVERLVICSLDQNNVNSILTLGTTREDMRSLFLYYTTAETLSIFVEDNESFPTGDDWSVLAVNMSNAYPEQQDVPAYEYQVDASHLTIRQGDATYVGTLVKSQELYMLQIFCASDYTAEAVPVINTALDWCARNNAVLLVTSTRASWVEPLTKMNFTGLRWTLRIDRNRL